MIHYSTIWFADLEGQSNINFVLRVAYTLNRLGKPLTLIKGKGSSLDYFYQIHQIKGSESLKFD